MPRRTPDQSLHWRKTYEIIGEQLQAYYQACTTKELSPRLLAALKKLDEETNPSAEATLSRPRSLSIKQMNIIKVRVCGRERIAVPGH